MSAFNWIKKLQRDERGNVLVVGAATMPLLMGSAALAIDTVQLALWKRQLQRAADSAAIAAAFAIDADADLGTAVSNDLDENVDLELTRNEKPSLRERYVYPGSWALESISNQSCEDRMAADPTIDTCFNRAVQVQLIAERTLPFMRIFTQSPNVIEAKATAAITADGEYCMVSLYDGTDPGIVGQGNPNLDLSCGIASNSRGSNALLFNGNPTIKATPVAAVGGITGGSHFVSPTTLRPYSSAVKDPFGDVPFPQKPASCVDGTYSQPNNDSTPPVMQEGNVLCYTNFDINGTLNLPDGAVVYVDNGLMDIKGTINGNNVTIFLAGDDSQFVQNGGGTLNITAPDSGTYKGIAVYRDRNAANTANKQMKLNGGAELQLTGAIYARSTDIWIGGNANFDTQCIQLVGRILDFKGGGKITNNCAGSGSGAFQQPLIRLVS